jgi:hypothetical protein
MNGKSGHMDQKKSLRTNNLEQTTKPTEGIKARQVINKAPGNINKKEKIDERNERMKEGGRLNCGRESLGSSCHVKFRTYTRNCRATGFMKLSQSE